MGLLTSSCPSLQALLLGLASLSSVLADTADTNEQAATYPLTTDSNCTCFKTNTSTGNYFAHHRFYDFRSLTQHVSEPTILPDVMANTNAPATNDFFKSINWTTSWGIQNWNNQQLMAMNNSDKSGSDATILMVNTPNNIYIERNTDPGAASQTYMTMRTTRLHNFQTAAEIESASSGFRFLSIRMLARTRGASGGITAMFTYRPGQNNNLQLVQEADLEIRTRDPQTRVQFTNQPSWNANGDIPAATRNVTMPNRSKWSDWTAYRMDWTPGSTSWYVNGQLASTITFQAPRDPSQVMFNVWSDGGSWSGNMSANSSAYMQVQYIEMVFNNTEPMFPPKPGACTNMCSIDETPELGTPVLISQAARGGQAGAGGNAGNQGGNRGGSQGGNQGGNRGGSQGGNQGGNTGGTQGGNQGGNRGGTQGGNQGGTTGGTQGGNQGGNRGGTQGGNQGGTTGGTQGGNAGTSAACAAKGGASKKYDQCAGKNWNGCGVCAAGSTCRFQNDYYSQCL